MPLVYNYYLNRALPFQPHRSTAHKRAELKNIYKSIVKLSAEEPLCKIELTADTQAYALGIKESALSLQEMLSGFSPDVFNNLAAVSENSSVLTAELLPSKEEAARESFLVEVKQLACGQENEGAILPSGQSALKAGTYTFSASIREKLYSFQFNVSEPADNFELQSKLADFINQTGIGIQAEVFYNKEAALSRLSLSAVQSGQIAGATFTLEDTSFPEGTENGGVLAYFGLDTPTRAACNTIVSVDGKTIETPDTSLIVHDRIQLSILGVSDTPVRVHVATDATPVLKKLSALTDSYNRLVEFTQNFGKSYRRSGKLLHELSHLVSVCQKPLRDAGIYSTEEGLLQMDADAAASAILEQKTQSLFTEGGFCAALSARLSAVSLNPMDYVDKLVVTYPNTLSKEPSSPYATSLYSGMLFNNYC